jgi:hypothetical protein
MFECQQNNDWLNKMRLQQAYRGFVTFPLTSSLWLERSISYAGLKRNQIQDIGSDPARAYFFFFPFFFLLFGILLKPR